LNKRINLKPGGRDSPIKNATLPYGMASEKYSKNALKAEIEAL
jgi:hypothetical protein